MKSGIELITEERAKGYDNIKDGELISDMPTLVSGMEYAYKYRDERYIELLMKMGALLAAEIDRVQKIDFTLDKYVKNLTNKTPNPNT